MSEARDKKQRCCGGEGEFFELQRSMLDVERQYRGMTRRAGIFDALTERLRSGQFGSEAEALEVRQREAKLLKEVPDSISDATDRDAPGLLPFDG